MKTALRILLVLPVLSLTIGCGGAAPAEAPQMTPELMEQIKAEDAAVEDAERAVSDAYKPAKKR
ncbi:hypothetical protein [Blastopirellula marina]|uniref:Secreted protein n=1 Tax=Blastopirellula marina TaxID=124 RepID=A0A2S8GHH4_9BACT|nr:hypothetical protein [Blastopirellula marina]PQO43780.1 hypothetical protein C5Y93_24425 [Blastopirellula marina]